MPKVKPTGMKSQLALVKSLGGSGWYLAAQIRMQTNKAHLQWKSFGDSLHECTAHGLTFPLLGWINDSGKVGGSNPPLISHASGNLLYRPAQARVEDEETGKIRVQVPSLPGQKEYNRPYGAVFFLECPNCTHSLVQSISMAKVGEGWGADPAPATAEPTNVLGIQPGDLVMYVNTSGDCSEYEKQHEGQIAEVIKVSPSHTVIKWPGEVGGSGIGSIGNLVKVEKNNVEETAKWYENLPPSPSPLKIGDKVKYVASGTEFKAHEKKHAGEIGEVVGFSNATHAKVKFPGTKFPHNDLIKNLVKIGETFEVEPKLKVGDWVKLMAGKTPEIEGLGPLVGSDGKIIEIFTQGSLQGTATVFFPGPAFPGGWASYPAGKPDETYNPCWQVPLSQLKFLPGATEIGQKASEAATKWAKEQKP